MRRAGLLPLVLLTTTTMMACGREDVDRTRRPEWVHEQAVKHSLFLQEYLNGTGDERFYDGWYDAEHDPKTGGAWRWMTTKGIIRFRTHIESIPSTAHVRITVHGWVPYDHVGLRTCYLEFAINGHVLEVFEPPRVAFEHPVDVPRALLGDGDWVDFSITTTNTARPPGEWRALGFATTGVIWTVVDQPR